MTTPIKIDTYEDDDYDYADNNYFTVKITVTLFNKYSSKLCSFSNVNFFNGYLKHIFKTSK